MNFIFLKFCFGSQDFTNLPSSEVIEVADVDEKKGPNGPEKVKRKLEGRWSTGLFHLVGNLMFCHNLLIRCSTTDNIYFDLEKLQRLYLGAYVGVFLKRLITFSYN